MADPTRTPQPQSRVESERRADADPSRRIVTATAGGGLVRVTVDGHRTVRSLEIAPQAWDDRDAELLADLIMAAITEAQRRLDDAG